MQHNGRVTPPSSPSSLMSSLLYPKHMLTPATFFSAMTIFFFLLLEKKRKPAGRVVVANLVGAWEKKHVGIAYTNGLHECAGARQNIEYELLLQSRPFLCLWCLNMCIVLMDKRNERPTRDNKDRVHVSYIALCSTVCAMSFNWAKHTLVDCTGIIWIGINKNTICKTLTIWILANLKEM